VARCPICSRDVPLDAPRGQCPHCASNATTAHAVPDYQLPGSVPLGDARFAPGHIFAARYRIVSFLGRGAMGEVYRADDLRVGHPVALKLLAVPGPGEKELLRRFVVEVRLTRHIAHPNVCRVYDIGEAEGWHYLSMEYVDGETLGSLLRRIGRMPPEKATDIARQLCAGLAAAHDVGVLHRDIKPSNIMIDGRGRVRLMDFGLAVAAGEALTGEIAGTPAYMSPEQLVGDRVNEQSDLYALGLIFYELFTGRPLFPVGSLEDRLHYGIDPPLGDALREFGGGIDGIVRACLARAPENRPVSAQALATEIPGGDLLTRAAAEGRLLAPDMLAAAGQKGSLSPLAGWGLLMTTLVGMLVIVSRAADVTGLHPAVIPKPPEVLVNRARDIVAVTDGTLTRADSEYWFTPTRPEIRFFYRQSAAPLVPQNLFRVVTEADPAPTVPGMVSVITDTSGRLLRYEAVGNQQDGAATSPDWATLFAQAGLDIRDYVPEASTRAAPGPHDARFAWREQQDGALHVLAATLNGHVAYFEAFRNEPITDGARSPMSTGRPGIGELVLWLLIVVAFVVAGLLARSHIRRGEGDRRGALVLSISMCCGGLLSALLHAHHGPLGVEEVTYIFSVTAWTLLWGVLLWLLYMGLEPMLRRSLPAAIVSWARLLSGRWRDPLVGRDLLLGSAAGVANVGIILAFFKLLRRPAPDLMIAPALDSLRFFRAFTHAVIFNLMDSIMLALGGLFLFLLIRRLTRNDWVAALIYAIVVMPVSALGSPQSMTEATIRGLTIASITVLIALRLGLLAYAMMQVVEHLMLRFPVTLDRDVWYFGSSTIVLLVLGGVAAYGCLVAVASQRRVFRQVEITPPPAVAS
jgi:serine/threonine-protein kinase